MENVVGLIASTYVNAQYYGGEFSLQGAFALDGPLGASIGGFAGTLGGTVLAAEILKKNPKDEMLAFAVLLGSSIGGSIIGVVAFGGTASQAIAMGIASQVAVSTFCKIAPGACSQQQMSLL
jgi:hypothetical protein